MTPDPSPPESPLASHNIPVRHLELALVWPVFVQARRDHDERLLEPATDPTRADFLKRWIDQIQSDSNAPWHEVGAAYPPRNGPEAEPGYSEFCYFHPVIRNFLYSNRGDIRAPHRKNNDGKERPITDEDIDAAKNRNLRILQREDLSTLVVDYVMQPDRNEWTAGADRLLSSHFQIDLCRLYLFDTQAAMLELKLRHLRTEDITDGACVPFPLNLRVVLKLQDIVRRVYAPYWSIRKEDNGNVTHFAGHCPRQLQLVFKDDKKTVVSTFGNFTGQDTDMDKLVACPGKNDEESPSRTHRQTVFREREPHVETVFQALLHPIHPVKLQPPVPPNEPCVLQFEQIEDERIPTFSYVAVDNPRRISTGDWIRLAALDDEGDSSCYPYSPNFLGDDPLAGFAYDRFWHPTGKPPAQDEFHSTRWLCPGYGFVGVGRHDPENKKFYSNAHDGALAHFRHHYFALGLIAHFQRASLLRFKHALAEAAGELLESEGSGGGETERMARFHEKTDRLMKEFLRFRTLYWFSEVSNQIQGRELFELYGSHLRLQPLFAEVAADMDSAATLLRTWDEEEQTNAAQALAFLGAMFLCFTPALDWLGSGLEKHHRPLAALSLFLLLLGFVAFFLRIPRAWLRGKPRWLAMPKSIRPVRLYVRWCVAVVLFLSGLTGVAYSVWLNFIPAKVLEIPPASSANVQVAPALPLASAASNTATGSKPNVAEVAPQKPNPDNEPPNQAAGADGDRATKADTKSLEP